MRRFEEDEVEHAEEEETEETPADEPAKTEEEALTKEAAAAPQAEISQAQEKYEDFGEKIGMARKDTATKGGKKGNADSRPSWLKKYETMNVRPVNEEQKRMLEGLGIKTDFEEEMDIINGVDYTKPFVAFYEEKKKGRWGSARKRYITGADYRPIIFTSKEQYEATVPVFEAKMQGYRVSQRNDGAYIVRPASNGKLVEYAKFNTKEDAVAYLSTPESCTELLNRKRENFELPALETLTRNGMKDYRQGKNVTPDDILNTFGFRGGEFGNWLNADERQQFLNYAYDALMDMAEMIGVSPKALSLNGELSIAFGARGKGGEHAAAAHYEPDRAVINLTKMNGAGTLAHEWAHALDNYFGLMDAKVERERKEGAANRHYLSEEHHFVSGARKEMIDAFKDVINTLTKKHVTREIAVEKAQEDYDKAELVAKKALENERIYFAQGRSHYAYNRKTKQRESVTTLPTEDQLKEFDQIADALMHDKNLGYEWDWKSQQWNGTGENAEKMYTLVSAIFPKGYTARYNLEGVFSKLDKLNRSAERLEKAKAGETETITVETDMMRDSKWFDKDRAGEYWTRIREMFARGFEEYLAYKMGLEGKSSDYLTYRKGTMYQQIWEHSPYPLGDELIAARDAYDRFFNTIQEKEGENGNVVLYENETGESEKTNLSGIEDRKDGESAFEFTRRVAISTREKYKGLNNMDISVSPDLLSKSLEEQEKAANGTFNTNTKKIRIFAKETRTTADAIEKTIFHEAVHYALDKLGLSGDSRFVKAFNVALVSTGYYPTKEDYQEDYNTIKETYEEEKKKEVPESEVIEEVVAHALADMLQTGAVNAFANVLTEKGYSAFTKELDKILNIIEYEREKEFTLRGYDKVTKGLSRRSRKAKDNKGGSVSNASANKVSENGRTAGRPDSEGASSGGSEVANELHEVELPSRSSNDIFFSNAERAVESIKNDKATPQQWLAMLEKNGGIKAGEDKWLGLSDWLKASDKKTLSKQEVLDYINENKIQIEEVHYAEDVDMEDWFEKDVQERIANGKTLDELQDEIDELANSPQRYDAIGESNDELDDYLMNAMKETYGDDFEMGYRIEDGEIEYNYDPYSVDSSDYNQITTGDRVADSTRINYTTEGLSNKREIALTVPTIEPWNTSDNVHFGDAGEGRAVAWARFGDAVIGMNGKALFIDEIQSKRHQEGREFGYSNKDAYKSATVGEFRKFTVDDEQFEEAEVIGKNGRKLGKITKNEDGLFYAENADGTKVTSSRRTVEEALEAMDKAFTVDGIPAAPFEKNWHELAMKRMLRLAAEEGYDYMVWTTGDQQAERYDIGAVLYGIERKYDRNDYRQYTVNFFKWLGKTAVVLMWLYVWSYMGWGNNYYRTGLYERNGIQRVSYEPEAFRHFLREYTRELNRSAAQTGICDRKKFEQEVRAFYCSEMTRYGYTSLHNWQHVKTPLLNGLFSAVLVQGYMGPFFCESQVNRDLLDSEFPYTAAHELAHLSGVTSEAEAGYWGYAFCRSSRNPAVRYSGYLGILPYVLSNAKALLSEQEYEAWTRTLSDKAKADYTEAREYWKGKRVGWIDRLQTWFYNLYLKSNGISGGVKDYSGVVSMIMTMDASKRLIEI